MSRLLQVCDTINSDISMGKDPRDVIVLLQRRLAQDNPHKQWLALQLVDQCESCGAWQGHREERGGGLLNQRASLLALKPACLLALKPACLLALKPWARHGKGLGFRIALVRAWRLEHRLQRLAGGALRPARLPLGRGITAGSPAVLIFCLLVCWPVWCGVDGRLVWGARVLWRGVDGRLVWGARVCECGLTIVWCGVDGRLVWGARCDVDAADRRLVWRAQPLFYRGAARAQPLLDCGAARMRSRALLLIGCDVARAQVLIDCARVLGQMRIELLQGVARVMAHPAKADSEAGTRGRRARDGALDDLGGGVEDTQGWTPQHEVVGWVSGL
eukprot:364986-Chlamydomonas_euryale.AAC.4